MNTQDQWQECLAEFDEDPPAVEEQIAGALLRRFDRRRVRRRLRLGGACVLAIVVVVLLALVVPAGQAFSMLGDFGDVFAVSLLVTTCGIVWIATDADDKVV